MGDNEQCNRRLSLRINDIPPMADREKETAEMCLEKQKCLVKSEDEVPDTVLDRTHRIGKQRIVNWRNVH